MRRRFILTQRHRDAEARNIPRLCVKISAFVRGTLFYVVAAHQDVMFPYGFNLPRLLLGYANMPLSSNILSLLASLNAPAASSSP